MKWIVSLLSIIFIFSLSVSAQEIQDSIPKATYRQVYIIIDNDTIPMFALHPVHVFSPTKFKDQKERIQYTKLVRDVRKTYPYAKMISSSIIETYEYMQTLPNDKARQKHLEEVQKYMLQEYKPQMKKMTKNQGKILMKLIDRQCNTSSYNIVKALLGSFKADIYNTFAGLFGNSLKVKYDPEGKDADIERIVIQLEEGTLDYYYSTTYNF